MKKIILMMLLLVSISANAQNDVTKFLGIPVDGSKAEMKQKLIAKGFTYNAQHDNFQGEFNGQKVDVYIVTNNNKVWRIMVCDANTCGETDIRIRFNNLCDQFARNKKYTAANFEKESYKISEDERISSGMLRNKRYEAAYYQHSVGTALSKYTQEDIDSLTEEENEELASLLAEEVISVTKRPVWFMISELSYGKYYIIMYYDNEYNHANGEDL